MARFALPNVLRDLHQVTYFGRLSAVLFVLRSCSNRLQYLLHVASCQLFHERKATAGNGRLISLHRLFVVATLRLASSIQPIYELGIISV